MLNLRVRPPTTPSVQPGQVLQRQVGIALLSDSHYLTGDTLTNLMLDPGGLSADSLRLGSEGLGVLISVVLLAEIRSLVQVAR